ncbi:MAG: DUF5666 domain-containing protein [Gammaproteobacteria bacterium]|nr:DUF5666 domain-containing protein [Gammaproteobacteria bacterium]
MNNIDLFKKTALVASIALFTACSGGGSSTGSTGGTSKTSSTSGVITAFGSVYINGVEYETDNASITIDGSQRAETELGVGDVCVLQGSVNADGVTGTASAITCTDELEGYVLDVSSLTNGIGTMNVMGQTVTITTDTVFDSDTKASIADLVANDIVEVHGYPDVTGNILATRIETKNAATDIEVKGLISNLTATTFNLGSLLVDYSSATEVAANLADGLYVEVKTQDLLKTGPTLIASKVEIEEDGDLEVDGNEGEDLKVQGVVSNITATSFDFNGTTVLFASLETGDDFDVQSLVDGMIITVEGRIDANGNFVVEEVEEDHASENEAEGLVTATTGTTIAISVNSVEMIFTVNNETRMIDEQDEGVTPVFYFSLMNIATGDLVEIDYYTDDISGNNIATKVQREDAPL